MKVSFGKLLIGVAVFGLCVGAAFAAGTVYGRHSQTPSASAAGITNFTRGTGASGPSNANGNTNSSASTGSTTGQTGASTSATPGARGGFGGGQGFFGGRPIEGKVSSISAQELQLAIGTGTNTATVTLASDTAYSAAQKADKSALTTGANIYVTTAAASDGTLTAQSVIVLPAGATTTTGASNRGATGASNTGTSGPSGTTGGRGGFGGGAFGGGGNRPVDGTVGSVTGQQLQVTLANGSSETVTLSDQTTYETTSKADQSAIKSGDSVLVTINRASDGTTSAQSVVVLPASGQ